MNGAAMEVLSALLHLRAEPVDLSHEFAAKRLVLCKPARLAELIELLKVHLLCGTGALLLAQVSEPPPRRLAASPPRRLRTP